MKFRHEYKHYINRSDYFILKTRLENIMEPDRNVNPEGKYMIRSLYFDNLYDKALREKIDGVNNREKFRFRYYNDDTSFIRLEKKSKINNLCNKQSVRVTSEQVKRIIDGDYEWMSNCEEKLVLELYSKIKGQLLLPKTIVEYIREPYTMEAGNVRITIDSEIKTGILNTDFLNRNAYMVSTNNDTMILEVKYDNFLPDIIKNIITLETRRSSAFSKYAISRIYG